MKIKFFLVLVSIATIITLFVSCGNSSKNQNKSFSLEYEQTKDFILIQPVKFSKEAKDVYGLSINFSNFYLINTKDKNSGLLPVGCRFETIESWKSFGNVKYLNISTKDLNNTINPGKFNGIDSMVIVLTGDKKFIPLEVSSGHIDVGLSE